MYLKVHSSPYVKQAFAVGHFGKKRKMANQHYVKLSQIRFNQNLTNNLYSQKINFYSYTRAVQKVASSGMLAKQAMRKESCIKKVHT
jgi:hypothetical protein